MRRDLRQPEVQNLGVAAIGNEDVRGFDVPVHDPLGVCGVQCINNLGSQLQQLLDGERLAIYPCA